MNMFSSILPFSVHIVRGHSMQPNLKEGNRIIVFNWAYMFSRPKVGDVIVFDINSEKYVKRITAVAKSEFFAEGDNISDSKKLPPISRKAIIGKVVASY